MSVNLLDMVKGAVSDQIMGQIGSLLGQSDTKKTSSMFDTAVGSILGGMMKKAGTPEGANDIFRAVQDQDDGMMDKLGDLLGGGGGGVTEIEQAGGGMLDMVFGDNRGGMMGAIAKFLGLDDSMMGKLMMMAAPIVMGVIGKHVKSKALDAVGLGSLLGEQKSFLGSSMPSALSGALGFGDMLGGATDAFKGAGAAVTGAAGDAAGAVGDAGKMAMGAAGDAGKAAMGAAGDAVDAGSSMLKMLLPLILLGAIAILGYTILSGGFNTGDSIPTTKGSMDGDGSGTAGLAPKIPEIPNLADIDFGDFDMAGMQEKFTGITDGFQNVTADSAEGLVGKITDLTGSLEGMGLDSLTGPAKTAAGDIIGTFVESIKKALEGITDDGIMGMLKPAVEMLIEKLTSFT